MKADLKRTTSLILLLAFGSMLVLSALYFYFLLIPEFKDIEKEHAVDSMHRVVAQFDEILEINNNFATDWAYWDDTYDFVAGDSPEYPQDNLNPADFRTLGASVLAIYDREGKLVWGGYLHADGSTIEHLPWGVSEFVLRSLQLDKSSGREFSGLARISGKLMAVACRRIKQNYDTESFNGFFFLAREIDQEVVDSIAHKARVTFSLMGDGSSEGKELRFVWSKAHLNLVSPLIGLDGQMVGRIRVTTNKAIVFSGEDAVYAGLMSVGASGFVVGLITLFLIRRRVVDRIQQINEQLDNVVLHGPIPQAMALEGSDELAVLAGRIDSMLTQVYENEEFMTSMLDSLQVGMILVDVETRRIVKVNPFAANMIGLPPEDILNRECHGFICPNEHGNCPILDKGGAGDLSRRTLIRSDGQRISILKTAEPIRRGSASLLLETFLDITELEKARLELERSESRYRTIFMNTGAAGILIENDSTISLANREFLKLSGVGKFPGPGVLKWQTFFHGDDVPWMTHFHLIRRRSPDFAPRSYEARFVNSDGDSRHVQMTVAMIPGTMQSIASMVDITDRKEAEKQLTRQAFFDELTGLANRQLFTDRLHHAITRAERDGGTVGVLMLDLDEFKNVNDSLGHAAGDVVLTAVAERLSEGTRKKDTVARLGGDEFGFVVEDIRDVSDLSLLADKILAKFNKPVLVGETLASLGASIGIAVYPEDGTDTDALLRNADLAMYRSKALGKNTFSLYTDDMNERAVKNLTMKADIRSALDNEDFQVWYQPQVRTSDGKVAGVEALVRWIKPNGAVVSPAEFIPFAEESGLVREIDAFVLEHACRDAANWKHSGKDWKVSVNISARTLQHGGLADKVMQVLDDTGLTPERLTLELTETTLMENFDEAFMVLSILTGSGIKFALDDFGTGHSSLYYLKNLPFQTLKIDKIFIGMLDEEEGPAFVRTILTLAENLNMDTMAEGVETPEQLAFLYAHGCPGVQGFYFDAALSAEPLERLMERGGYDLPDYEKLGS